jgi:hypothetical protein
MMSMTERPSAQKEELGKGVRRYWLTPRIVVIETDGDMSPAAIDVWAEATEQAVLNYPVEHQSVYVLQNLAHPNQRITPYARQKTETLYASMVLTRRVYVAVVLQNSFVNQIVSMFVRLWDRSQPLVTQRIFTASDAAIQWLESTLTSHL